MLAEYNSILKEVKEMHLMLNNLRNIHSNIVNVMLDNGMWSKYEDAVPESIDNVSKVLRKFVEGIEETQTSDDKF